MSSGSSSDKQTSGSHGGLTDTNNMSEPASISPGGAVTKVLGIDELLLLILENVPKQHLPKLRRSLKKWNEVVSTVSYVVKPIFFDSSGEFPYTIDEDLRHELDVSIGINPAINSSAEASRWPHDVKVALETVRDPTQLLSKRQEFITSPPIMMIKLGLRERLGPPLHFGFYESTAILKDDTGICIGLMLNMFDKMRAQAVQPFQHGGIMSTGHAFRPVAFFRYSGVEVETYLEQAYTEWEWDFRDTDEDQGIEDDNDGRGENGTGGGERISAGRPCRTVAHC